MSIYEQVTPDAARAIVQHHCQPAAVMRQSTFCRPTSPSSPSSRRWCWPTAASSTRRRWRIMSPAAATAALAYALREMTPEEVCQEIIDSGLRGRGGAGYPDRPQVGHGAQGTRRQEVCRGQRRRRRPRRVHGSHAHGVGPASRARGHGHRRLCRGRRPGLPLRARRVPDGGQAAGAGDPRGGAPRPAGQPHSGQRLQLPHRRAHRRRRLRLRRGDRAHGLDHGHAAASRCRGRPIRRRAGCGASRR